MKEKLKKIIREHNSNLQRFEFDNKKLISKMAFYREHKLSEEERIARIKYDAQNMLLLEYRDLLNSLKTI